MIARRILPLAALILILALWCPAASAETSGDFEYEIGDDGCATITKYLGGAVDLTLPDALDGHPVTAIGEDAFQRCMNLRGIVIPHGVTSIGRSAFMDCRQLSAVSLPDSLTDIGSFAFNGCDSLTGFTVSPDSGTFTGINGILYRRDEPCLVLCPCGLEGDLEVQAGTTAIGPYAFSATRLRSVTLPEGVTVIRDYAFFASEMGCVTLPDTVATIGESAFAFCNRMVVAIPASVTHIGEHAFDVTLQRANGKSRRYVTRIIVIPGTYAAAYAEEHNLAYTFPDGVN